MNKKLFTKEELLRWQYDEEFQLKMINERSTNIKFIHKPSKKVQLEAVKKNDYSIQYIPQ